MDLEELKSKLKEYKENQIIFKPHAKHQLILREGNKKEVIANLLNPTKLFDFEEQEGKKGDRIYKLYFEISNSRTMILPVIFKRKCLYILTYIMRHRLWKKKIEKRYGKKWKK
jgi:hypothetical protein